MKEATGNVTPKRGEIWLVNFDPTVGSEIRKTRPALILQNDTANRHSPVTIVAAISAQSDELTYPTEVLITQMQGIEKPSIILLNQIRTIDKQRMIKKVGIIKPDILRKVDRALKISLDLND
ncbi:MAG: type II toxin-antitoxin system PemK/MazF family toxin [bacterium]|nr:type II toxin-antitoxin system PemK/MazF family toxin [bacterium]